MKQLIWWACKDSLPTKTNLIQRIIVSDNLCEICKQREEDILHALYPCPELQSLWSTTPSWNQDTLKQSTCFTDFIVSIFVGLKELELFMVVLWNLWKRRNNLRLGKPTIPLNKVLEHSREQQIKSHFSPLILTTSRSKQPTRWTPPSDHWYKLNFNGTTFADKDTAGIGIVVLNSDGLIMASLAQQVPLPPSVIKVDFGVKGVIIEKFMGSSGKTYVNQKIRVVWGLKISPCTMTHCWQNKLGGCYMTLNPFFIECSKPSFSQTPWFWKQNVHQVHPMLGRA